MPKGSIGIVDAIDLLRIEKDYIQQQATIAERAGLPHDIDSKLSTIDYSITLLTGFLARFEGTRPQSIHEPTQDTQDTSQEESDTLQHDIPLTIPTTHKELLSVETLTEEPASEAEDISIELPQEAIDPKAKAEEVYQGRLRKVYMSSDLTLVESLRTKKSHIRVYKSRKERYLVLHCTTSCDNSVYIILDNKEEVLQLILGNEWKFSFSNQQFQGIFIRGTKESLLNSVYALYFGKQVEGRVKFVNSAEKKECLDYTKANMIRL